MQKSNKRLPYFSLFVANALIYGLNGIYNIFVPIYLEYNGKTNDEIGYILAVAQLVAIFAPFFWGVITDKSKYKNNVLMFLILCSTVCFVSVCLGNSLIYLFIMLSLVMFFQNNFGGLIDTITVEACNSHEWKYGGIRVMGTLGYGVISMVLAPFVKGENISLIFAVFPIVGFTAILSLFIAPKVEGHARKKEKISLKPLFTDRMLMINFILLAASMLAMNYFQVFYSKYMIAPVEAGGLGLESWIMGVNTFLTVAGEIVFFLMYNVLMERIGVKKLLWISVAAGFVRYLGLALCKSPVPIMLIALFTGLVPTVITYCATYYMMRTVTPNVRASGQMAMYALCHALPRCLSSALGGVITQNIGTAGGLMVCTGINIVMFIPLLFMPKKLYGDEQ